MCVREKERDRESALSSFLCFPDVCERERESHDITCFLPSRWVGVHGGGGEDGAEHSATTPTNAAASPTTPTTPHIIVSNGEDEVNDNTSPKVRLTYDNSEVSRGRIGYVRSVVVLGGSPEKNDQDDSGAEKFTLQR